MKLFNKIKKILFKNQYEVELINGLDDNNLDFDSKEDIQKKIEENKKKINSLKPTYDKIVTTLSIIQKIFLLPKESILELENLVNLYSEAIIEKETYKEKIKKINDSVMYLEDYQEQMPKIIKEMKEYEEKGRIIKNDLDMLEGEKGELLYSISRMNSTLKFIKIFIIILIFLGAIDALILTILYSRYNYDIFLPSIISVLLVFFFGLWIFIFRRYLVFEIVKNKKLLKRAVELLNKVKIKYVNNQQVLEYQYKKYKVNSSEVLQLRWDNYNEALRNKTKYKRAFNNLSNIISEIEKFLKNYNIKSIDVIMEYIEYFSNKKSRNQLYNEMLNKKENIHKIINETEKEIKLLEKMINL